MREFLASPTTERANFGNLCVPFLDPVPSISPLQIFPYSQPTFSLGQHYVGYMMESKLITPVRRWFQVPLPLGTSAVGLDPERHRLDF